MRNNIDGPHGREADWPKPRPLEKSATLRTYPVSALGEFIGPAVEQVAEHLGCSHAIAAQALLTTSAIAVQAQVDVGIDGRRVPTSLYTITVAESGERKSAARDIAIEKLRQYERKIQSVGKDGLTIDKNNAVVLLNDVSVDGVDQQLRKGYPAPAVFPDEGGSFLGGPAMAQDSLLRGASMLCSLYAGQLPSKIRADKTFPGKQGVRFSMNLPMTPTVAADFMNNRFWDQGIGARCLIVNAPSLAGSRTSSPGNPRETPEVKKLEKRIGRILSMPLRFNPSRPGELNPATLTLSNKAEQEYRKIAQRMDELSAPGERFERIKGMASRAAEQVLRLAAIMTFVADPEAVRIKSSAVIDARKLVSFYLLEGLDLNNKAFPPAFDDIRPAQELLRWLCVRPSSRFTLQEVYQLGPRSVRRADKAKTAIQILARGDWVRARGSSGRSYEVYRP